MAELEQLPHRSHRGDLAVGGCQVNLVLLVSHEVPAGFDVIEGQALIPTLMVRPRAHHAALQGP